MTLSSLSQGLVQLRSLRTQTKYITRWRLFKGLEVGLGLPKGEKEGGDAKVEYFLSAESTTAKLSATFHGRNGRA